MQMSEAFLTRGVNEGFSGGEKKRNEVLQMLVSGTQARHPRRDRLRPRHRCAQSGFDGREQPARSEPRGRAGHALSAAARLHRSRPRARALGGRIVKSGDRSLALELERRGYDWVLGESGVHERRRSPPHASSPALRSFEEPSGYGRARRMVLSNLREQCHAALPALGLPCHAAMRAGAIRIYAQLSAVKLRGCAGRRSAGRQFCREIRPRKAASISPLAGGAPTPLQAMPASGYCAGQWPPFAPSIDRCCN